MKIFFFGIWGILAALIILVMGVLGVIIINNGSDVLPSSSQSSQNDYLSQTLAIRVIQTASLEKNYNYDFNLHQTDSLLDLFNTLDFTSNEFSVVCKDFDFGKMITTVNGYTANNNEFWNLKLNGQDAQVGISELVVKPGDKVELILTSL